MKADTSFPIVGVGASAGGIQALESLFRAMPADPGMSFVVIMHLAPDRKSLLTEILARHAKMGVEVARDGQEPEKDKIYVMPPATVLTIAAGRLRLIATDPAHHERSPIDIFFSALARDRGEYAVGIVLSGSGSDGVLGIKALKEHGGVTMAQATDESGPGFGGMPGSAIASGLIDFAIPVDAMAEKLVEITRELNDLASDRRMTTTTTASFSTRARPSIRSSVITQDMTSAATRRRHLCAGSGAACISSNARRSPTMWTACARIPTRRRRFFAIS